MTKEAPVQPKKSLFSLTEDQRALIDLLTEVDGDVTDESASKAVDAWMAELRTGIDDKFDAYAQVIRKLELDASVAKAERDRYAMLCQVRENAAARMKERLKLFLVDIGAPKRETQHFKFSVQANGGKQPMTIVDQLKIPEEFGEMKWVVNNTKVYDALAAGKEVPGAALEARGSHLRIK